MVGLAFLITDILYITFSSTFDKTPIEYFFKVENSPNTLFLEVFAFWHTLVGAKLFLTLSEIWTKNGMQQEVSIISGSPD